MKKIMMICAIALMITPAQGVTVKVYSIHTSDEEGGWPYEGLIGYFNSPDIQFAMNTGYLWHPFGLQNFGAEMTGCLNVADDDIYEFGLDSDDGSILYIDGVLVVNNGGAHSPQIIFDKAFLTAGNHPFRVEFYEDFGDPSGVDLILPEGVTYLTCGHPAVSFTADPEPAVAETEMPFEGEFTVGCVDDVSASWDFGDGEVEIVGSPMNPLTTTHTYDEPGVYTVTLAVEDWCGHYASDTAMVVVYDPADGFVTGGGWIEQPLLPGGDQFSLPFFDGNYYEMVTIDPTEPWISWNEANDMADAMRDGYGHLVTITSQDEQDFLYEAFGSSLQNKWYGGSQDPDDLVADEGWQWVTGEDWFYTNWADWEPNDGEGEPGSEQFLMGWSGGTAWNDAGPSYEPGYVVEYEGSQLPIGRATFGFVCRYNKKDKTPIGETEFMFQAGDLNFHSSSYDWLLVTGSNYARFKGSGTINGSGDYKFMLWAGDDDPDTFRIKIWEEDDFGTETVIYDNGFDQAIGGGSIVIHAK